MCHATLASVAVLHVDDVLADVMRRDLAEAGIRILGVDGASGSGKSTLAARLAARSGAPLIHIDDFVSWLDFAGWWPRLECEVLTPLLLGLDGVRCALPSAGLGKRRVRNLRRRLEDDRMVTAGDSGGSHLPPASPPGTLSRTEPG
jgi:hypothetical protein